jgi:hypothetical protein
MKGLVIFLEFTSVRVHNVLSMKSSWSEQLLSELLSVWFLCFSNSKVLSMWLSFWFALSLTQGKYSLMFNSFLGSSCRLEIRRRNRLPGRRRRSRHQLGHPVGPANE